MQFRVTTFRRLSIVMVFASFLAMPTIAEICWLRGTAPFCDGSCEPEEEFRGRADSNCLTGDKAICCVPNLPLEASNCRWRGTAIFCAGSCTSGEYQQIKASDFNAVDELLPAELGRVAFGEVCVTGSKVLCCDIPPPRFGLRATDENQTIISSLAWWSGWPP